jgi:hypothetical protein
MKWLCLALFGSVGLTAFACGLGWGFKRWKLVSTGVKTFGTVADIIEDSGGRSRSFYPHVQFTTPDGVVRKFKGSTGSSSASYETGQRVAVVYNRANPDDAQIADFEQFWLGPVCVSIFGFLFLAAGIGGFFLVQDSDRTFGPAFEAKMAEVDLISGGRGIKLPAVVTRVRAIDAKDGKTYVIVCRGGAPGGASREFESAPLAFDPGPSVVGKPVAVYADPTDAKRYAVQVELLFKASSSQGASGSL